MDWTEKLLKTQNMGFYDMGHHRDVFWNVDHLKLVI